MSNQYCAWLVSHEHIEGPLGGQKTRQTLTCANCGRVTGRYLQQRYVAEGRYLRYPRRICKASE